MPAVPGSMYANQQPSCFQKMKAGFTIGFCVGMASGALFGGFSALRYVLCIVYRHVVKLSTHLHRLKFQVIFFFFFFFALNQSNFRYGLRGRELINNVGKVMIQGGGTFGTFMAIGTGIRC